MKDLKQIKIKEKIHPMDDKQINYSKLLEKYYRIAGPDVIKTIKREIFNPKNNLNERKKAYKEYKDIIFSLKPVFKEIVIERNRIFKEKGINNYFDFISKKRGIPPEKISMFFDKADEIIKNINENLPSVGNLPKWYWSVLNIPDFLYFFRDTHKYIIPDDIYRMAKDYFPEVEKIISKIEIGPVTDFNPSANFIKETKSVLLKVPVKPSLYNALTFIHELGHAFFLLKLSNEGVEINSKSTYLHEKEAYKFKFQFEEKCMPKEIKNASRGRILGYFYSTFFEYDIYNNPDQNFDKAYAKAINRCFPRKFKMKENPFYVLDSGLMSRPADATASVICAELLI